MRRPVARDASQPDRSTDAGRETIVRSWPDDPAEAAGMVPLARCRPAELPAAAGNLVVKWFWLTSSLMPAARYRARYVGSSRPDRLREDIAIRKWMHSHRLPNGSKLKAHRR